MNDRLEAIHPTIGQNVYIAPTAYVGGEVTIGDECTIMHHVTIRGDVSKITIGRRVNVQDGTIIHTLTGVPLEIGDEVVIGHRAVVHCRRVGNRVLIGIGAVVLDNCELGDGALIAAGAVISPGTIVPPGKLVAGVPGKVLRDVTEQQRGYVDYALQNYARLNRDHAAGRYPNWNE
jgi:carbonic anhydrase/acetyltransferase-like protein (isoleucine patch superfamily)